MSAASGGARHEPPAGGAAEAANLIETALAGVAEHADLIRAALTQASAGESQLARIFSTLFALLLAQGHGAVALSLARALLGSGNAAWPLILASDECAAAGDKTLAFTMVNALAAAGLDMAATRQKIRVHLAFDEVPQAAAVLAPLLQNDDLPAWMDRTAIEVGKQLPDGRMVLEAGKRLMAGAPRKAEGAIATLQGMVLLGQAAEARASLPALLADYPDHADLTRMAAEVEAACGDLPAAIARGAALRRNFPKFPAGYALGTTLLLQNNDAEAAFTLAAAAVPQFPRHAGLRRAAAVAGVQAGHLAAGADHWAALAAERPRDPTLLQNTLRALRQLPDQAAADDATLLANAAARAADAKRNRMEADYWTILAALSPQDPAPSLNAARALLKKRTAWEKQVRDVSLRLYAHHRRFPGDRAAYVFHAASLRSAGQFGAALALAQAALVRWPDDVNLALEEAETYLDQGLAGNAVLCLKDLRGRVKPSVKVENAYIRTLSTAGQNDEAEAACTAALAKFPNARALYIEHARLATRGGNWDAAEARLLDALAILPDDVALTRELQHVRDEAQIPSATTATGGGILAGFDSLGGMGTGCEFGLVQRKLGVDRLSLLRWARLNPAEIIDALENQFAGVGSKEQTELAELRASVTRLEYYTTDRRYGMSSHTFVQTTEIAADKFYVQACRRLKFLAGRLVEDLREGGRIYVYKANAPLPPATLDRLFAAFGAYGDNALFIVGLASPASPLGSVVSPRPGLILGAISSFMDTGPGGIKLDEWRKLCEKAAEIWPPRLPETAQEASA